MMDKLIGNERIKAQISIALGAARLHNRPLPHMLFSGLPGCGKTSMAKALAQESGTPFIQADPETLKSSEGLHSILAKLPADGYDHEGQIVSSIKPAIVFIDEAHQLSLRAEEMLGIVMEEWLHTFTVGSGRRKQSLTTWVPKFTLICATTKAGSLSKPFRDRFKLTYVFGEYNLAESIKIVKIHAERLGIVISEDATVRIAQRGRGTPRLLVSYLERVKDATAVLGKEVADIPIVEAQFKLMGVDSEGLTNTDITILKCLYESDVPVGLETLALRTNQDERTVKEVNEPYLLRCGFMGRSKQGRVITERGEQHLAKFGYVNKPAEISIGRVVARSPHG